MAATLAAIRAGIRDRLLTVSGLRASAYMEPNVQPPMACVLPARIEYNRTFQADGHLYLDVWIYVQTSDLVQAQKDIDEYMMPTGGKSISAALDGDQTLGGVVDGMIVRGWMNYMAKLQDDSGKQLLAASLQVEVLP